MRSRKITDGTIFVVFDMEWNQPFPGKKYPFDVANLTGEIIEIGASKYEYSNGMLQYIDAFSCQIKPQMYRKIHFHVKKVTGKTNADLQQGETFADAYTQFRKFCGDDFVLVGWGTSDPDMLKMNLKFHNMDSNLNCFFLDVQPIFSLFSGEAGHQRSVEFAVDYYGISKDDTFHSALADAKYEGEVFRQIFEHNQTAEILSAVSSSSINPDMKREFSCVGSEAPNAEQALKLIQGFSEVCPLCEAGLSDRIAPFRIRKSVYGLKECNDHGELFLRTRVKKNKNAKYYASSVLRFATQNDYFLIGSKKEEYDQFGTSGKPQPTKDTNVEEK